jgi:iron complex outermembrane receptor protein
MEYKHVKEAPDFGIPAVGDRPANIPRERNLGEPFAYSKSDDILLGMNWSHQFNDQWKISHKFNSTFTNQNEDVVIGLDGLAPNSTQFDRFYSGFRDNKTQTYANNLDLTGNIDAFGIKHTLLFGGDYYIFHNSALLIDNFNFPSIDVNHPVHSGTPTKDPVDDFHFKVDEEWYGLYFQDQVQLPHNIHVLAGFRYDNARFTNPGGLHKDDAINPRVGLLWQPIKVVSLYGNYVQNFGVPNIQFGAGGANLSPQSAQQWEAGIKTELFNGRLTGTLAWYQLTKQNIPSLHRSLAGAQNNEFDLTGEAVNEGVELDIAGEILPGWNVIGSYSHIDSKITSDSGKIFNLNGDLVGVGSGNTGHHLPNVPEHGGSLWSTYQFQTGALQGLKLGAGIVARSQRQGNRENNFQLPGYALFNLMAGYEFKVGKTKIFTQLNVNNLLDKTYWPSTDVFSKGQVDVGSPRTFIGSIKIEL